MATQCNATELIPARQNPPKDGHGPRGVPDCYYTSRVLDSTARYVKFVKKLRALEEEQRKGAANTLKDLTDKQISDFFIRCDRRSLINNVARRVDLCLSSYQEDLKAKRRRLLNLLSQEEELNIRKFVEQAQAGAEALWQDKKDRLAYLLAKRQKEHEEKYKDVPILDDKTPHETPDIFLNGSPLTRVKKFKYLGHIVTDDLKDKEDIERERRALAVRGNMLVRRFARCSAMVKSKCAHVHPCIVAMHARESQEGQLYQMKEKQARKMADIEFDNMWHEAALKESEALAARMELDTIARLRRNHECVRYGDEQIRLKKEKRKREQEQLKQETMKMMALYEEQNRQDEEEKRRLEQKRFETALERRQMIQERKDTIAKQDAEAKLIADTFDSLADMGLAGDKAKEELIKQKRREVDVCNQKSGKIAQDREALLRADEVVLAEDAKRLQDLDDKKRCDDLMKRKKATEECREAVKEQIKENAAARERKAKEKSEYDEYQSQLAKQLEHLVAHRELTEAQARKLYQKNLQKQIDYNQLLKDRLKEEELLQREKYKIATEDYKLGLTKIMSRLYFSDEIHPFAKPMRDGVKMREKCPCSTPDYCAVPVLGPKGASVHKPGTSSSE